MVDDFTLARVIHVTAIVGWIGGVWFVTFVAMPAIARSEPPETRLKAFHRIEAGFAPIARALVALAGLSGFWLIWRADMWDRFVLPHYWWMHAMVGLWTTFAVILFVAEPLFLHQRIAESSTPDADFRRMHFMHRVLSILALITVFGSLAGAHGLMSIAG